MRIALLRIGHYTIYARLWQLILHMIFLIFTREQEIPANVKGRLSACLSDMLCYICSVKIGVFLADKGDDILGRDKSCNFIIRGQQRFIIAVQRADILA